MQHPMYFGSIWTVWAPQKSSCDTFAIYIFHLKTKWNNSLRKLKNKNILKRHIYPSPNALNIKYFWTLIYKNWVFWGITKLSNPYLQENGMPKNIWMQHWQLQWYPEFKCQRFRVDWSSNQKLFHHYQHPKNHSINQLNSSNHF